MRNGCIHPLTSCIIAIASPCIEADHHVWKSSARWFHVGRDGRFSLDPSGRQSQHQIEHERGYGHGFRRGGRRTEVRIDLQQGKEKHECPKHVPAFCTGESYRACIDRCTEAENDQFKRKTQARRLSRKLDKARRSFLCGRNFAGLLGRELDARWVSRLPANGSRILKRLPTAEQCRPQTASALPGLSSVLRPVRPARSGS